MTKQEEIREGVAIKLWLNFGENICPQCKSWKLCPHKQLYLDGADFLLSYLHDNDVVIKVDRELPMDALGGNIELNEIARRLYAPIRVERIQEGDLICFAVILKALFKSIGYVAVESLIKEDSWKQRLSLTDGIALI